MSRELLNHKRSKNGNKKTQTPITIPPPSKTKPAKEKTPVNFVAVDGEAIDDSYCLLGTSLPAYCLENENGITTLEALQFLWSMGNNRHLRKRRSIFVSFYFAYDVEMICRNLPTKIKQRLFNPRLIIDDDGKIYKDRVYWKDFELTYVKRKYFSIRRKNTPQNGITIFDVCGFFVGQGSFIQVLEKMKIEVPEEIIKGKAERGKFKWQDYQEIKRYNQIECELLVKLMNRIHEMTERLGLTPRRWYGSSAIANFALRKWNIRDYMRRTVEEKSSGYFWEGITCAYFGGRIEAFKLGSFRKVKTYDINSAYPYAITLLPCTRENRFNFSKTFKKGFGVWKVRFNFRKNTAAQNVGVLPYRCTDGSIKFPLEGIGWYWNPEVELALKHFPDCLEIVEGYYLENTRRGTPFKKIIPELYQKRLEYKEQNDLTQWIIKILLNALYGKFAQKVGRADFKNFVWAGWITSYTRAKLREAVIGKEKHIIAFATDGIYSEQPLEGLKLSNKIGEWDFSEYDSAKILMSGVYLLERNGKKKTGQRGFQNLSQWKDILDQLTDSKKAEIIIRLFVGFNMAFNFPEEYGDSYLQFVEKVKILNPYNLSKRRYHTREIENWNKDNCSSSPIRGFFGLSKPINTDREYYSPDDILFSDCEEDMTWIVLP